MNLVSHAVIISPRQTNADTQNSTNATLTFCMTILTVLFDIQNITSTNVKAQDFYPGSFTRC
jgi:hypothetical protein